MMQKTKKKLPDLWILSAVLILSGISLSMLFSAGMPDDTSQFYFNKQLLWLIFSLVAMSFSTFFSVEMYFKHSNKIILISIILLLLVFVPFLYKESRGTKRWINLYIFDFYLQPSEIAKIATIIFLSSFFVKNEKYLKDFIKGFLPAFAVILIVFTLILLEPDFSTASIILIVSLFLFYIANIPLRYLVSTSLISLIPLIIYLILSEDYRIRRIIALFFPNDYPDDLGYQLLSNLKAFTIGGFWGTGIGNGSQKKFIPEPKTDSIFAVFGEELGFAGCILTIILFLIIAYRGYKIAYRIKDKFKSYLAFGLTTYITLQALVNISIVLGLMPPTGLPLPFISYGGASLVTSFFSIGILLNISRNLE